MNTVWEFIWESGRALLEILTSEVTPAQAITTFTLLNLFAIYAFGRSVRVGRMLVLWMLASLSIVLWTVCIVLLNQPLPLENCPQCLAASSLDERIHETNRIEPPLPSTTQFP